VAIYKQASGNVALLAYDTSDGSRKTGLSDITVKVSKDAAAGATLSGSVSELDATDFPGVYIAPLTGGSSGETDADLIVVYATSATSNVAIDPVQIQTTDVSSLATATDQALILADTNELQGNQGQWLTATGFSTHSAADVYSEFTAGSNEDAFKADVSSLATSSDLATVDGIVDNIFTGMELDGSVYRWTTNALEQAPSSGGGGDATSTKQDQILAKLSTTTKVIQNPDEKGLITFTRADDVDSTTTGALSFDVGKSVDTASATFTVRSRSDDTVALTTAGSCSGNVVTVSLTSAQTDITAGRYKYDVEVTYSGGTKQTVSSGSVNVQEGQTR